MSFGGLNIANSKPASFTSFGSSGFSKLVPGWVFETANGWGQAQAPLDIDPFIQNVDATEVTIEEHTPAPPIKAASIKADDDDDVKSEAKSETKSDTKSEVKSEAGDGDDEEKEEPEVITTEPEVITCKPVKRASASVTVGLHHFDQIVCRGNRRLDEIRKLSGCSIEVDDFEEDDCERVLRISCGGEKMETAISNAIWLMNVAVNAYCDIATSVVAIKPGIHLERIVTSEAYGLPPSAREEREKQFPDTKGMTPQQVMKLNEQQQAQQQQAQMQQMQMQQQMQHQMMGGGGYGGFNNGGGLGYGGGGYRGGYGGGYNNGGGGYRGRGGYRGNRRPFNPYGRRGRSRGFY